ncbi:MAG: hypothetical protein A3E84_00425 [Gammaproteobacteria bacterium RIFCSPHIGHO2_12_FULL_42_13]|nr:MAG: hypothetical protein A3E84_00425 [Gammaproteobacteria bacterium RIFCSPHIGHO2_12_FULL_42_13]
MKKRSQSIVNEIKENIALSIPLTSSQMIYAFSGFLGTAMVAHLGQDALAASVLVSMIWLTLSVFFFGILNSVSVLVSHQFGAKNYHRIGEIMGQAYLLGIVIGALIILVLCSMPLFLHWSEQPQTVLTIAYQYMRAILWTIPGLVVLIITEQFLAGVNHARLVLRVSLLIVPVEIVLVYLLIFGKFGLPAFGVAGVGYGYAITYTITAILLILYLTQAKPFRSFRLFSSITTFKSDDFFELIRLGLPLGFMYLIEVSTFAVMTFWIGRFGTTILAAHQIVMQYLGFIVTLVFAMSQAVTIRVSHAIGGNDMQGIKSAVYIGMLLNFACIFLIAIGFTCVPAFFLTVDIDVHAPQNQALVRDASSLLFIAGILLIFDNFRIVGFGALRGLKDTTFSMYTSLIAFWLIGLTCSYLFAFNLDWQGHGIWWGLTIGIASGAFIIFLRLQYLLARF